MSDFSLEDMMSQFQKLLDAKALLDTIYSEAGGYGGMLSKETLSKLNDFYGFNDSE